MHLLLLAKRGSLLLKGVNLTTEAFEDIVEFGADGCTKLIEVLHREKQERVRY